MQSRQRPQSPTNNRLNQYFNSSTYLDRQQELSVFIPELPVIDLQATKSINDLMRLLITQNELLGDKCQQQVGLLKESFIKYEGMAKEVRKYKEKQKQSQKNRQDKQNIQAKQIQKRQQILEEVKILQDVVSGKEKENLNFQNLIAQLQSQLRQCEATLASTKYESKECQQDRLFYERSLKLLLNHQYRQCSEFLKQILNRNQRTLYHETGEKLLDYCQWAKYERKKMKVYAKMRKYVDDFGYRFEKILQIIDPNLIKKQLSQEVQGFVKHVNEIFESSQSTVVKKESKFKKNKNREMSLQSDRLSSLGSTSNLQRSDDGLFQSLLDSIQKQTIETNISKNQLSKQLEIIKKQLQESKQKHLEQVSVMKAKYEEAEQSMQHNLQVAEQSISYYTDLLGEKDSKISELTSEIEEIVQKNEQNERQISILTLQNQKHLKSIQIVRQQSDEAIKRVKDQHTHDIQFAQLKFNQQKQLLEEQLSFRKRQYQKVYESLEERQSQLREIEKVHKELEAQSYSITQQNSSKSKQVKQLEDSNEKMSKQIEVLNRYKEVCSQLERQIELQKGYIIELENKTKKYETSIQELKQKSAHTSQNKKELALIKNTLAQEKQKAESYENYIMETKEQNQRLKSIVKEMKKELEDVYVTIAQLKKIEQCREQLEREVNEQRRINSLNQKREEAIKLENLKLESENKKLSLEAKHYRNIVNRLQL